MLKSGRDVNDALLAVVIRNLKLVKVCVWNLELKHALRICLLIFLHSKL